MKQMHFLLVLFLVFSTISKAQKCTIFVPDKIGTEVELTHYDKKDKVTGISKQAVKDIKKQDGATYFYIHQLHTDEKGENPVEADMEFKCQGGTFYVDMNAYINQEQMAAYEGMEMKVTTTEMGFPGNPEPGQLLEDGNVTINIMGPMPLTITTDVVNRKIEAIEEITTPAGTFECVKIVEDVNTKMVLSYTIHTVSWYCENLGVVKSETYKKDKLIGSTVLTAINK